MNFNHYLNGKLALKSHSRSLPLFLQKESQKKEWLKLRLQSLIAHYLIRSRSGHLFCKSSNYGLYGFGFIHCIFILQQELVD